MKLIDEQYVKTPFYGIAKMTEWLSQQGHSVNHKRVRRLMRQMGLEAVYPRRKRGLSIPDTQHKIYPHLLRDVEIIRPVYPYSSGFLFSRTKLSFSLHIPISCYYRTIIVKNMGCQSW
jgi:putative transposase